MALWKLPATTLSSMLARGETSAWDVVRAHIDRIDEVDGILHAFTEVLREQAIADASESDARRSRGEARGPLDGVPVTVKECFDMAGRATTLGIPSWRGHIAAADAAMVTALREAGAIILGRTNLSQTMLFVEARNPIFGQTSNPWSLAHSPGGSSGGEGAAIASGMSPLGVGTDIGGSIRTPAAFCGITGFKPTLDRLPMRGYRTVNSGQETVRAMGGPLARSVGDLSLFFRSMDATRTSRLDPRVPPLEWRDAVSPGLSGLRIGTYVDDSVLPASTAIARAVARVGDVLRARGSEVVHFQPPDVAGMLTAYLGVLSADGGAGLIAALTGGDVDPSLESLRRVAALPAVVRRVALRVARSVGQGNLALLLGAIGEKTVADAWQIAERLHAYRASLLETMDRGRIDAIVCPVYATPAFPHHASEGFTLASSYSILFNATQLPAGVVPVTRVRAGETFRAPGRDRLIAQAVSVDERSAGLPVGVQIVGRPWKDPDVLALMGVVEADVSGDADFPRTPVDPKG